MKRNIHVYPDKEKLITAAAERTINSIDQAVKENGLCNIALAGGNTPRGLYALLAMDTYKERIDWSCVHLFWGDERMTPPDNPDSNFGMVRQVLLEYVIIPEENIHRIRGEGPPEQAAVEYSSLIQDHFKKAPPCFDLILLGLGEDGHTASLFPGTDAIEEYDKSVVAVFVPELDTWRVTLTLPVINAAREVLFLVSGSSKSKIMQRIMSIENPTKDIPATLVNPKEGAIDWMLDSEAVALINKNAEEIIHGRSSPPIREDSPHPKDLSKHLAGRVRYY